MITIFILSAIQFSLSSTSKKILFNSAFLYTSYSSKVDVTKKTLGLKYFCD